MEKPKFPEVRVHLPNGRSLYVATLAVRKAKVNDAREGIYRLVPDISPAWLWCSLASTLSMFADVVEEFFMVPGSKAEFDCDYPEEGQPCGKCPKCVERMADAAHHNFGRD